MSAASRNSVGTSPKNIGSELRELAAPIRRDEKIHTAIERAARLAGLTHWRAFDLWYGKARRVEEYERDQVREALSKKQQEATRNEFHELRTRMAILEARLVQTDEAFHREDIARLRAQGGGFGGIRRPVTACA